VLFWAGYAWAVHPAPKTLLIALLIGIALTLILGVPAATIAARESGRHDPQFVVIDEVAGQWIALLFSPADWRHALIALVLFRLFDITKPFPARQLESLPEGWGIVFDDVAAGLYALGVASLLRIWI
jgi:phosphatidylglycerophosphatase A